MKLFDVYPLYNITPVKASSSRVWDDNGTEYLDLYGGHAVISIGHSHPHYLKLMRDAWKAVGEGNADTLQVQFVEEVLPLLHRLADEAAGQT